jgi:hypothetical protein
MRNEKIEKVKVQDGQASLYSIVSLKETEEGGGPCYFHLSSRFQLKT